MGRWFRDSTPFIVNQPTPSPTKYPRNQKFILKFDNRLHLCYNISRVKNILEEDAYALTYI